LDKRELVIVTREIYDHRNAVLGAIFDSFQISREMPFWARILMHFIFQIPSEV